MLIGTAGSKAELGTEKLLRPFASCDEKYKNVCFLQSNKFTMSMPMKYILPSVSEHFSVQD